MTSRALVARQPRTLRHADSLEIRSLRTPCGEDTRAPIARGLVPPRAPDPKPRMPIRAPPHRTHTRAPHLLDVLLELLDVVEIVDVEEDGAVGQQQREAPLDHRDLVLTRGPDVRLEQMPSHPRGERQLYARERASA